MCVNHSLLDEDVVVVEMEGLDDHLMLQLG